MLVNVVCKNCGKTFEVRENLLKRGRGVFCSKKCSAVFGGKARALLPNTGEHNPNWKNGISSNNYHYKKLQRERYPDRIHARTVVYRAKKNGTLINKPCVICGDINVVAHHEDYSKPLDVIWLCRKHHSELHNGKIELL